MYRLLLRAFPREFRRQFGTDMTALFAERRRDARRAGAGQYLAFWSRTLIDITRHGVAERRAMKRKRGESPMRSFFQDMRFALRLFRRRPGLSATAVMTLALGIGVNVAMFSVINGVLLRDLPFPHPERLVRVGETGTSTDNWQPFNAGNYVDVQRETGDAFQALAAYRIVPAATLTGIGEAVKAGTVAVRPEFFDVLATAPAMGRPLTATDLDTSSRSVVISDGFWRGKLGSDPQVVGRSVELDGQQWTIVGVLAPDAEYPSGVELWKPMVFSANDLAQRNSWSLNVIGRLRPSITLEQANASAKRAMSLVAASHPGPEPRSAIVVNLREDTVSLVRRDLVFVQGVTALILLIACANLGNLLLATATARHREFSVRAAIGAGRARLVRQMLAESFVISAIGGSIGAALAFLIVPALVAAYPGSLPGRERIGVSGFELVVAIGAALLTNVMFGLAPALLASRTKLTNALRPSPGAGASPIARWLRNGLVTAEVVMTLSLVAGAGLLIKSFATLTAQPVGFDTRNVLAAYMQVPTPRFPTEGERLRVFESLLDRLAQEPDVESVATTLPLPFDGSGTGLALRWDPALGFSGSAAASARFVSPRYADVLSVPLLRGRFIAKDDRPEAPLVAVVNESFSRQYGRTRDVIGMRMRRTENGPWITIVGIVADVRANFLQKPRPEIVFPVAQTALAAGNFIIKTRSNPTQFAHRVRQVAHDAYPNVPMGRIEPMDVIVGDSVAQRRFNMSLLVALALLALLLSVIGIYGVMAYVVTQRRREMGIRVALGAHPAQVQALVVRQGLIPIVIGIAGGLAGAWFLTALLTKELFEIKPHDPWTLAASAVAFLAVGLAACWLPARSSSRVNPVEVLRAE